MDGKAPWLYIKNAKLTGQVTDPTLTPTPPHRPRPRPSDIAPTPFPKPKRPSFHPDQNTISQ